MEQAAGARHEPRGALASGVDPLFAGLDAARQSVEHAEHTVDALLADMRRAPRAERAEKVTVSAPLEAALQRLRDAREILAKLVPEQ